MDFYKKILFSLLAIAMVVWSWHPIQANDIWWHLASGRYIIENHRLPRVDVFSSTAAGHSWINHEWLFQLLAYLSFQMAGIPGLLLLKALLMLSAFGVLARYGLSRKTPALIGWAILATAFWASRPAWSVRADLMSILFMTALTCHLSMVHRTPQELRRFPFWVWPFLFCLWANMHGGFVLGLSVICAFGLGWIFEGKTHWRLGMLWSALCAAATVVNPWGYHLYFSILKGILILRTGFIQEWMRTPWQPMQLFWACLCLYWMGLAFYSWNRRASLPWSLLLTSLLLSWSSIRYVRNVPYFMLGAFPFMAEVLSTWPSVTRWISKNTIATAGAALLTVLFISGTMRHVHGGIDALREPVEACSFISDAQLPGHFFNDYSFGGYWMWHFGTTRPVFIDGRLHTVEGYTDLYHRIENAQAGPPEQWEAFLQSYGADSALVPYSDNTSLPAALEIYFPRTRWALVYWDDTALIFLKRIPAYEPWIKRYEFPAVAPDAEPEFALNRMRQSPALARLFLADLERNSRLHPNSRRVQQWLSVCQTLTSHVP